jgi:hypothetical protein
MELLHIASPCVHVGFKEKGLGFKSKHLKRTTQDAVSLFIMLPHFYCDPMSAQFQGKEYRSYPSVGKVSKESHCKTIGKDWSMAQMVECLPSLPYESEALSSNPSGAKK